MTWIAKRAVLSSGQMMPVAIYHMLINFVDDMKHKGKLLSWYTSLKNDDSVPSVRIYMKIRDADVHNVMGYLHEFLEQNRETIGWTGAFYQPDEKVKIADERLAAINKACEIVLDTYRNYPMNDRLMRKEFRAEIKSKISTVIATVNEDHQNEFLHFTANNLAMNDTQFQQYCTE